MKLQDAPWKKSYDQHRRILKSRDITLPTNVCLVKSYGFSISHVWMWELDYKESWVLKNWCFWTVVLRKTLESPLDFKEIHPVHPKGNQSWIFIGRTDAEAEAPTPWPPDVKNGLIGKGPDAGEDWSQEKGTTEDEMVEWHQWLYGHEFEQAPGVGDGQGGPTPGVLQSVQSQRVRHDWVTELKWTESHLQRKAPRSRRKGLQRVRGRNKVKGLFPCVQASVSQGFTPSSTLLLLEGLLLNHIKWYSSDKLFLCLWRVHSPEVGVD